MINTEDASLLPSPHYITSQHSPLLPFRSTDSRSIFFLLNLKLIEFNFFFCFLAKERQEVVKGEVRGARQSSTPGKRK
jgi:hypothetical protein